MRGSASIARAILAGAEREAAPLPVGGDMFFVLLIGESLAETAARRGLSGEAFDAILAEVRDQFRAAAGRDAA